MAIFIELQSNGTHFIFQFYCCIPTGQLQAQRYRHDRIGLSFRRTSIMVQNVYFCQTANVNDVEGSGDAKIWNVDENRVDMIGHSASEMVKGSNFRAFTLCVER